VELKLVRGIAADLTAADKRGRVVCRVGEMTVRLHRDLSTAARAGDEVLVGGEFHNGVVHAVALKNFTHRKKLSSVDFTLHILGAGFGGALLLYGLIFYAQSTADTYSGIQAFYLLLLTVGAAILFFTAQQVPRINKLTRWVDSVNE